MWQVTGFSCPTADVEDCDSRKGVAWDNEEFGRKK
jgi:hypothetical protein